MKLVHFLLKPFISRRSNTTQTAGTDNTHSSAANNNSAIQNTSVVSHKFLLDLTRVTKASTEEDQLKILFRVLGSTQIDELSSEGSEMTGELETSIDAVSLYARKQVGLLDSPQFIAGKKGINPNSGYYNPIAEPDIQPGRFRRWLLKQKDNRKWLNLILPVYERPIKLLSPNKSTNLSREHIRLIATDLFGGNFQDYFSVFASRKMPIAARTVFKQLLYTKLRRVEAGDLEKALDFLLQPVDDVTTSEAQRLMRLEKSEVHNLAIKDITDNPSDSEHIFCIGGNQEALHRLGTDPTAHRILSSLKTHPAGFATAVESHREILEYGQLGILEIKDGLSIYPNRLSIILETLEDATKQRINHIEENPDDYKSLEPQGNTFSIHVPVSRVRNDSDSSDDFRLAGTMVPGDSSNPVGGVEHGDIPQTLHGDPAANPEGEKTYIPKPKQEEEEFNLDKTIEETFKETIEIITRATITERRLTELAAKEHSTMQGRRAVLGSIAATAALVSLGGAGLAVKANHEAGVAAEIEKIEELNKALDKHLADISPSAVHQRILSEETSILDSIPIRDMIPKDIFPGDYGNDSDDGRQLWAASLHQSGRQEDINRKLLEYLYIFVNQNRGAVNDEVDMILKNDSGLTPVEILQSGVVPDLFPLFTKEEWNEKQFQRIFSLTFLASQGGSPNLISDFLNPSLTYYKNKAYEFRLKADGNRAMYFKLDVKIPEESYNGLTASEYIDSDPDYLLISEFIDSTISRLEVYKTQMLKDAEEKMLKTFALIELMKTIEKAKQDESLKPHETTINKLKETVIKSVSENETLRNIARVECRLRDLKKLVQNRKEEIIKLNSYRLPH